MNLLNKTKFYILFFLCALQPLQAQETLVPILINTEGEVITNKSNIVVNVASLKSDSGRRDKYISRKSLESNTYPEALINIKKINNLPWPIPKNDSSEIEIIGDMTAHGVTQQITWKTKINFLMYH